MDGKRLGGVKIIFILIIKKKKKIIFILGIYSLKTYPNFVHYTVVGLEYVHAFGGFSFEISL